MTSTVPADAAPASAPAGSTASAALADALTDVPWPSAAELSDVVSELRSLPPLTRFADCAALRVRMAEVALGGGHVIQGGDCAELFAEVGPYTSRRKAAQLGELADLMERATGRPAVAIGRIAGQFGKPRSHAVEPGSQGLGVPVYRGDAVNALTATAQARTPDPRRLLTAYRKAAEVHSHLRDEAALTGRTVFTSHEALLLDYERALTRFHGTVVYGASAHLLWCGERTRATDGAHVALLAGMANPLAVKLGPRTEARHVADLVRALDPDREPGRLAFIVRLGADRAARALPALVDAAAAVGARPAWICDPMHGNTERLADGRKVRSTAAVAGEIRAFVRVLRRMGGHPAGLHLELTPDDVTECVDAEAADPRDGGADPFPRYWTGCDPRLNPAQARAAVRVFLEEATS